MEEEEEEGEGLMGVGRSLAPGRSSGFNSFSTSRWSPSTRRTSPERVERE